MDDNQAFLVLAKELLADSVPALSIIATGHDGYDAVRLAERHTPDLIIMDLFMPSMGGLQATRLIKAQDRPPLVLIASHYDDAKHREHCAQAGADGFIGKQDYEVKVAEFVSQLVGSEAHA
ncbi:MAG TPA: response regulator transcription factor [Nevskiaceae bacterium]|nr:response regulator transcription factor [Nevskiaceae bacterium]